MNRQTKRMMQRQKADRVGAARKAVPERRDRVTPGQFFREVRQELKKVNWPTRRELLTYTVVVLVTVVVLTTLVFGIDFVVAKGVLAVFGLVS